MALIWADRVKETSNTTGTSDMTLLGAVNGFQAFSDAMADSDICYYTITDGTDWEVGEGTYSSTGPTLVRSNVLASSNANAKVSWTGATEVFLTHPASISANTVLSPNTATDNAIARFDGSSGLFIQDSSVFIDDSGNVATVGLINGRDVDVDGTKLDGIESNATADQTDAEIKTAYENNADTNAYTDSEKSKLAGIEANATQDQTASEILALVGPLVYPVGSIYMSSDSTDPSTVLGFGTWAAIEDKFILGASATYPVDSTGGSDTHSHPLSSNGGVPYGLSGSKTHVNRNGPSGTYNVGNSESTSWGGPTTSDTSTSLGLIGDTDNETTLPPYVAKYAWERTA